MLRLVAMVVTWEVVLQAVVLLEEVAAASSSLRSCACLDAALLFSV